MNSKRKQAKKGESLRWGSTSWHSLPGEGPKTTLIVTFLGADVKTYLHNYPAALADRDLQCPICGGRCHCHGWYRRWVYDGSERAQVSILRVICLNCGRTHAVVPDFIRPYGRHSQQVREKAVIAVLTTSTSPEKAGQASFVDAETVRRWVKEFKARVEQSAGGLVSILARHYPERAGPIHPSRKETLEHAFYRMAGWCRQLAQALPALPRSSSLFGLVNILLAWGGLRIWV